MGNADAPSSNIGPNEVQPTSTQFSKNSVSYARLLSEKLSRNFLLFSSRESRRCENELELRFGLPICGWACDSDFMESCSERRILPERLLPVVLVL